jgi:hypothetical protein
MPEDTSTPTPHESFGLLVGSYIEAHDPESRRSALRAALRIIEADMTRASERMRMLVAASAAEVRP